MPNLHSSGPDTLAETQSITYDLLPVALLSYSGLTAPGSGMALPNVAMAGYVRRGTALVYVTQGAHTITLAGSAGQYWLALHADTHSAVAGWTRVPGSHYLWQGPTGTPPATPDGGLVVAVVVVTGASITSVAGLTGVASPLLSQQHADVVAITGGNVNGLTELGIGVPDAAYPLDVSGNVRLSGQVGINANPTPPHHLTVQGTSYLIGSVGIGKVAGSGVLELLYNRATTHGIIVFPNADSGPGTAITFANAALAQVGSITTTGSATAYNTASDPRLKTAVTPLEDALQAVLALAPVQFVWKADGTPGQGFLADAVQQVVPQAVTGAPEAVDAQGRVVPMQLDLSKLVPHLVGAVQTLAQQVAALTARLEAAGG